MKTRRRGLERERLYSLDVTRSSISDFKMMVREGGQVAVRADRRGRERTGNDELLCRQARN